MKNVIVSSMTSEHRAAFLYERKDFALQYDHLPKVKWLTGLQPQPSGPYQNHETEATCLTLTESTQMHGKDQGNDLPPDLQMFPRHI